MVPKLIRMAAQAALEGDEAAIAMFKDWLLNESCPEEHAPESLMLLVASKRHYEPRNVFRVVVPVTIGASEALSLMRHLQGIHLQVLCVCYAAEMADDIVRAVTLWEFLADYLPAPVVYTRTGHNWANKVIRWCLYNIPTREEDRLVVRDVDRLAIKVMQLGRVAGINGSLTTDEDYIARGIEATDIDPATGSDYSVAVCSLCCEKLDRHFVGKNGEGKSVYQWRHKRNVRHSPVVRFVTETEIQEG